ncbi:MAG: histidine kinase dimerization/phospho-acceptor domain-containing protein, partial [Caulobacterales bacterium]
MATLKRLPAIIADQLAWAGAGAGVLAALLIASDRPVTALLALAAGGASGWLAVSERTPRPVATDTRPPRPMSGGGLSDLTPLLEALPEPALLVDADGRIAGSNAAARLKLQFEAAGLRLSSILRQPDVLDAAQAAARDGATSTIEYEDRGQVEQHVRCYVAPVQWGDHRAALIAFHDETARINTERMRSDFVANASHELRTPLSALMLLIETIGGPARDNPEDIDKFLRMMQAQGERMRRLIDDLLSLSRIELDEHVPPTDRADLAVVAKEVVDSVSAVADERGVSIAFEEPAGQAWVIGHRFQLVQVVQNLVDNAVKYSSRGGVVTVEVGVAGSQQEAAERAGRRWGDDAGRIALVSPATASIRQHAYVRVTDAGPGIERH